MSYDPGKLNKTFWADAERLEKARNDELRKFSRGDTGSSYSRDLEKVDPALRHVLFDGEPPAHLATGDDPFEKIFNRLIEENQLAKAQSGTLADPALAEDGLKKLLEVDTDVLRERTHDGTDERLSPANPARPAKEKFIAMLRDIRQRCESGGYDWTELVGPDRDEETIAEEICRAARQCGELGIHPSTFVAAYLALKAA